MATEVSISDHTTTHEEVKEEIHGDHAKEVEQKIDDHQPVEEVKDSPSPIVDKVIEDEKPKIEEPTCLPAAVELNETEETEPITIEEVKKIIEEQTPTSEVIVADKETEIPAVVVEEKETCEPVNIQEETPKTEIMATENETKTPAVEQEEKKTTSVEEVKKEEKPVAEVEAAKSEEQKTEKEPENAVVSAPAPELKEKIVNEKDCVEEKVPEAAEKEKEPIVTQEAAVEKKDDKEDLPAIDKKKEDDDQEVAKQSVPADEIAMLKEEKSIVVDDSVPVGGSAIDEKKQADPVIMEQAIKEESKADCLKETEEAVAKEIESKGEPIKIEEAATKTATAEPVTNGSVTETAKETTVSAPENPSVEPIKTSETPSKEEKPTDETKQPESTPKEEEKTTPKQSNSIMGKVKKSFLKAKKAITGKNTPTKTPAQETKEDETPKA